MSYRNNVKLFSVMFHILVVEKNGVETVLGMTYTLLDLMDHIYGQVNTKFDN